MNTRGSLSNQNIRFIFGTIYLIAVITAIAGLILINTPTEIHIAESELQLFALRLLNDPALAWQDPLLYHQRSGIIDARNLEHTELRDIVTYPPGRIAARIKIEDRELYYDKATYRRLIEQIGIKGGPSFIQLNVPLIIREGMSDRFAMADIGLVQS